jgi:NAD(P)-dependent dehydrogenase (short-subunit alcohol dehydrogenase family)
MKPTVVITGVSSGIGRAAVRHLSSNGYFVFGSVRSAEAKAEIEVAYPDNFEALVFDVTDKLSVVAAAERVAVHLDHRRLAALINNAGIAEGGPLQLLEDERFLRQMKVNVIGTRNVTNAFLPHLGVSPGSEARLTGPPGKIINITSISGILNTPMNGAYCVSKHAQESLGEVYRRELMDFGIDVVSIQPGPIQSKLWEKNIGSLDRFSDSIYGTMVANTDAMMREAERDALPAVTISRLIDTIIRSRRPRTQYIVHQHKRRAWILANLLPARWTDWLLWRRLNRTQLPGEITDCANPESTDHDS